MSKKMNIVILRDELNKVFSGLKSNRMNPIKAREMNNTGSKIMQSVSLEMKRETQTGRKRVIDFIDNGIVYHKTPKKIVNAKSKSGKK